MYPKNREFIKAFKLLNKTFEVLSNFDEEKQGLK